MKITTALLAVAAIVSGSAAYAQSRPAESSADAKQDAYLQSLHAQDDTQDQRQQSRDKAFYQHQTRLHDDLAAARRSGNMAEVARLQRMQAQDTAHLQREHQFNVQDRQHDARLNQMDKSEAKEDAPH